MEMSDRDGPGPGRFNAKNPHWGVMRTLKNGRKDFIWAVSRNDAMDCAQQEGWLSFELVRQTSDTTYATVRAIHGPE